ncbi:MAG: hypothetical protein AAGM22_20670 [Acidobacteriota bacterium]
MERVAFLVEDSGERIRCLLNPETIEVRRFAGVRRRASMRRPVSTEGLADDPLQMTGGGHTELRLHLLFDLAVERGERSRGDVRQLTRPLWNLAEGAVPRVRFIWGKSWNVPGVVTAVAERLGQFDAGGAPRRSWLSVRFLRVQEQPEAGGAGASPPAPDKLLRSPSARSGGKTTVLREMPGDGSGKAGERLDEVAQSQYGDPAYWRLVASSNGISEPLRVRAGAALKLPDAGNVS